MGKSDRQRRKDLGAKPQARRGAAFAWKSVDVARRGDSEEKLQHNHYDNASLRKSASKDLEALPQEAPGIFFGLEVLEGDSYRVDEDPETKQKRMVPVTAAPTKASTSMTKKDADAPPPTKKRKSEKNAVVVKELPLVDASNEAEKTQSIKRKNKKSASKESQTLAASNSDTKSIESSANEKKKKKNSKKKAAQRNEDENDLTPETIDSEQITIMQTTWSSQTGGVSLHPTLCKSLIRQKFWAPTPIQASALPASILGRRNIVGSAPTGSGKTLAFLLPIGQSLLDKPQEDRKLVALILTPTRELATQIQSESDKLLPGMAGSLVGGLAHAKQIRVLEKKRPPILIATPGRLWEMMSSRDYDHLNELSQIRFLVIDEADRMTNQGSFPQLSSILDAVQRANPMEDSDDEDDDPDDSDNEPEDGDRLLGLPGFPGEAKLTMLNDDILNAIQRERESSGGPSKPEVKEVDDEEIDAAGDIEDEDDDNSQISLPPPPPVHRQTFVYSATLTLPATPNFSKRSPKKKPRYEASVDGAIAEILEKSRAKGKTKVVDLSNMSRKASSDPLGEGNSKDEKDTSEKPSKKDSFRLPDGLTLQQIKCTQRHKDSHLYAYLMTTAEGASGPSLVFCNSIAGVRRVGATLQSLGLDVRILHAQMQQRARFKAVELLSESKRRTVVVATDVAARGLDIPSVASVVHYDTARTVDSFVHRSGRTARGVGANAVGCSVSLVAPDEDKMHNAIVAALGAKFERIMMDGRLLHEAQERVNLASKVAEVADIERKSQRQNQWMKEKAADAGLELDEDLLEEGLSKGDRRDRAKLVDADRARKRLAEMLSQPMRTQRYGKFLSTNSAFKQNQALPAARPVTQAVRSKKRRRRR